MTRAEGIALTVRDGLTGTPLRAVVVRAVDGAGATAHVGQVVLDTEGRGELVALKPGRYRITVQANGYAAAVLPDVGVPGPALGVSLTPGGTLEVRAGERTRESGTVAARLESAAGVPYPFAMGGAEGRVVLSGPVTRLENLAPGRYTLALPDGASRPFAVVEGGTAVVELP